MAAVRESGTVTHIPVCDMATTCRKCQSPLVRSSARGRREGLAFDLGSEIRRCISCESRFIYFNKIVLPGYAPDSGPSNLAIGWAAYFIGLTFCFGLALWTLHKFHRWPF